MPDEAAVEEALVLDEEAVRVLHWRLRRFLELGFTLRQARQLASVQADWHTAGRLLDRGCTVDVAFDVLS